MSSTFQMPEKVSVEKVDDFSGTFILEPLEIGYGNTIGNTLRRILISSLEGFAISSIKIPGVRHEFSTIDGVHEDVVELVLNLKEVRFKKKTEASSDLQEDKVSVSISKKTVFKAGDISKFAPNFFIINPGHIICNLDPLASFDLVFVITKGRGYVAAPTTPSDLAKLKPSEAASFKPSLEFLGQIPIDAIYTPIKNVRYRVENTRVGDKTDYERLVIDIQTDGSIKPDKALTAAAAIATKHFFFISNDGSMELYTDNLANDKIDNEAMKIRKASKIPIGELVSVRALNCLKTVNISTLGELASLDLSKMSKVRNVGKKTREELEDLLKKYGLQFGMKIENN